MESILPVVHFTGHVKLAASMSPADHFRHERLPGNAWHPFRLAGAQGRGGWGEIMVHYIPEVAAGSVRCSAGPTCDCEECILASVEFIRLGSSPAPPLPPVVALAGDRVAFRNTDRIPGDWCRGSARVE